MDYVKLLAFFCIVILLMHFSSAVQNTGPIMSRTVYFPCTDSDNGINSSAEGEVTINGSTLVDKCVGPFLIEYYCEDGKITSQNFRCEKGCSKGVCI